VRRKIEDAEAAPNIPPKANRVWKNCFSPYFYRNRNAIEQMFGRLKDLRRLETLVTIGSLATSTPPSASMPSSAAGYESQP